MWIPAWISNRSSHYRDCRECGFWSFDEARTAASWFVLFTVTEQGAAGHERSVSKKSKKLSNGTAGVPRIVVNAGAPDCFFEHLLTTELY